ncbi:hypothetical protein M0802_006139 [Mischocyttarus mexicanus]|nr:hypothetical protein M0802_006139 [Mischocyttarus mexicanus]
MLWSIVLVDPGFEVPPMLSIPHQLVGAPLGYSVKLECNTEAHPTSLNYWTREDKHMIHDSSKYKVVSTPEVPSYKTHMTLEIFDIQMEDYGAYKCVAKNPRGNTDGVIRLYNGSLLYTVNSRPKPGGRLERCTAAVYEVDRDAGISTSHVIFLASPQAV